MIPIYLHLTLSCICLSIEPSYFWDVFQSRFINVFSRVKNMHIETHKTAKSETNHKKCLAFFNPFFLSWWLKNIILQLLSSPFSSSMKCSGQYLAGRFPVVPTAVKLHVLFVCLWQMLPVAVLKYLPLSALMSLLRTRFVSEPRHFPHSPPACL